MKQLISLGPCRENRDQQQQYLLNLATRFQTVTLHALAARYGADSLFDSTPGLKLATAVVLRNGIFAEDVWKRGHTMAFRQGSEVSENSEDDDGSEDVDGDDDDEEEEDDPKSSDEKSRQVRRLRSDPSLDDILPENCEIPTPKRSGMIPWLEEVYQDSRGFELGSFDASLLPVIWKKQSANWNNLALGYVSDIVTLVHTFVVALISAICDDKRVESALMSMLMDGLIGRYQKSIDHARFVISVETDGTPLTTNHYFTDNLEKR